MFQWPSPITRRKTTVTPSNRVAEEKTQPHLRCSPLYYPTNKTPSLNCALDPIQIWETMAMKINTGLTNSACKRRLQRLGWQWRRKVHLIWIKPTSLSVWDLSPGRVANDGSASKVAKSRWLDRWMRAVGGIISWVLYYFRQKSCHRRMKQIDIIHNLWTICFCKCSSWSYHVHL